MRGNIKGFDMAREETKSLEEDQLKYLRVILVLFEGVSRLHINRRKSFMHPINEVNNMYLLASILGEASILPTTYLGMPLGTKSKSLEIWNGVVEKCEKKLARWETHYLSRGGRLTLISSILDALLTYMLSLFPILARITKRLDNIRKKFL
ncbi:hypothetical protein H5410_017782 [Solanum commersonii]|uniref:Uncharacterized protein n=1 Tax=Solanum commersonii TaxID=4109 RepID=A0A9J6A023_SOLCO|nr:hypothetical protein H5410_017782 [Solanum commersonii]